MKRPRLTPPPGAGHPPRTRQRSRCTPAPGTPSRAGFTLIEIALAALVIGLGILTLFGLARVGVQSAAEAEDETRAALFADNVFASLRTMNHALNQSTNAQDWTNVWTAFRDGETNFLDAAWMMWKHDQPGGLDDLSITGDGRTRTNRYVTVSHREAGVNGILETRMDYTLNIKNTVEQRIEATLNVRGTRSVVPRWGPSERFSESYPFYTHFPRHGPLPGVPPPDPSSP